jgi:branched-chain amino acid transport system ATP-binding protein
VRLEGKALRGPVHKRARAGLAFVTEECIFHGLSTADNLRLGLGGVEGALRYMPELRPLPGRRACLLSGGEQQFLAMARSLAMSPRLLMIDEVLLGLAPLVVTRLYDAIRAIADSGVGGPDRRAIRAPRSGCCRQGLCDATGTYRVGRTFRRDSAELG